MYVRIASILAVGLLLSATSHALTPINDLGTGLYLNQYQGGLYENGLNTVPSDHDTAGRAIAATIQPLDANGNPSATGKIGLMSIGMSNTIQKWCAALNLQNPSLPCNSWSFTGQATADGAVDHANLILVPGALGSQDITKWDDRTDPNWNRVATQVLPAAGLTNAQIQVIWIEEAIAQPSVSLPNANADAFNVETGYANIIRIAKQEYPNLKIVFVSSRAYAGYATVSLNPEPYAYETGFAVKWLVQAQIDQMRSGTVVDTHAGDLNYNAGTAPWIGWGPYFWADGTNPRSDGLTWRTQDVDPADGTHPSPPCPANCGSASTNSGEYKAGNLLLQFFKTSPYAANWFLASQSGDTTPPSATITSPTQNQALSYGTTQWNLTVTTNEPAHCKHHNTDVAYASMSNSFNGGALLTSFSSTLLNLQNGQTRDKYVRCQDATGNTMQASAHVQFTIASTPTCGNGVQEGVEQCDLGASNGLCPSTCSATCSTNTCTNVGDLNQDGIVSILDVQLIANHLGQTGSGITEDLNSDQIVNIFDLVILAQHWG